MEVYCLPCVSHGLKPVVHRKSTIPELIYLACCYLKVDMGNVLSRKRTRDITEMRHMIMAYLSNSRGVRLVDIGRAFKRDHTTVIYAKEHVSNLCATDKIYSQTYTDLTKYLNFEIPN